MPFALHEVPQTSLFGLVPFCACNRYFSPTCNFNIIACSGPFRHDSQLALIAISKMFPTSEQYGICPLVSRIDLHLFCKELLLRVIQKNLIDLWD